MALRSKLIVFFVALATLTGSLAFAQSQGPKGQGPQAAAQGDALSLTGNVFIYNRFMPVLKSGGKEYELMIPRYLAFNLGLNDGDKISVEGNLAPAGWGNAPQGVAVLLVSKATVDGKEYVVSNYGRGPGWGNGWGNGMMGAYGRRGGPGYGMMGGYGPGPRRGGMMNYRNGQDDDDAAASGWGCW